VLRLPPSSMRADGYASSATHRHRRALISGGVLGQRVAGLLLRALAELQMELQRCAKRRTREPACVAPAPSVHERQ
jgi:hypothetical protein